MTHKTWRQPLRHSLAAAALALLLSPLPALAAPATTAPAGVGAGVQMWDLRDLYPTPAAWDAAYAAARAQIEQLDALRPVLATGVPADVLRALSAVSDARRNADRLVIYANLKADENLREALPQERRQQGQALGTLMAEKTAWLAPALQALGAEKLRAAMAAERALKRRFDAYLEDTLRNAPRPNCRAARPS
jgi:oligoendopeptidase F